MLTARIEMQSSRGVEPHVETPSEVLASGEVVVQRNYEFIPPLFERQLERPVIQSGLFSSQLKRNLVRA
jgi:hypothetical protein